MRAVHSTGFVAGQKTQNVTQLVNDESFGVGRKVTLFLPHEGKVLDLTHGDVKGGHGGADPKMLEFLFAALQDEDFPRDFLLPCPLIISGLNLKIVLQEVDEWKIR